MFNEVGEGRYNLNLSKLLNMKGPAPAPQLSGDLAAGITLESDRPEWYALQGGRLCIGYAGLAAGGVGFRSQIVLQNPSASGVLAIIERVDWLCASTAIAANIRTGINLSGFGTSTNVFVMDLRLGQTPACNIATKNSAAAVGTVRGIIPADTYVAAAYCSGRTQQPMILPPLSTIGFDAPNDNQDFSCVIWWRERAANPAELALGA